MRVVLLTPRALPDLTGNAVTIERWRRGLAAHGVEARVVATAGLDPVGLAAALAAGPPPDVIHAYHATRSGALLLEVEARAPIVVSLPGTDIDHDAALPEWRATVEAVCARAAAIATQSRATVDQFAALFPSLAPKLILVPKAHAWLGEEPFDLRGAAELGPAAFVFFHPAGLRPVKGQLECLAAFDAVHAARPRARLVFAGPEIDAAYAARLRAAAAAGRRPAFVRILPPIPLAGMRAAYAAADVVLNTSHSEGLANALLEADAAGRPALVADIPGNRAAKTEYVYTDAADFAAKAIALVDDAALRARLAGAARARAARAPPVEEEAGALARIYAGVV